MKFTRSGSGIVFFLFGYVPSFPFYEKVKKALSISAFKQQTEVWKISNHNTESIVAISVIKS